LPAVASQLAAPAAEASFQSIAMPGSKTIYQFDRIHLQNVPWTYFVLSPLSSVTKVADDQVRASLLIAGVVALLAVLLGLLIGTRTAAPMQRSVADLRGASAALNALAAKQQNSASEQLWVVDACKTGLESVRYLSDAMHQAAHRVVEAGNWFGEYWDRLTEDQAQRTVHHLRELAQYIEEAARRQWASSERLDKAITVTTQVSDQLAGGAAAAAESAGQLEDVVEQLRRVVGGRAARDRHEPEDGRDVVPAGPAYGHPSGAAQRALPAPASPMNGYPGQMAPNAPSLYGGPGGPHQPSGASDGYPDGYEANAGYGGYAGNGWGAPLGNQPSGGNNGGYGPGMNADWRGRATNGPGVQVWEDR
jgi:X-X-X-Leu-X-X-Gly heptad repeat protein